MRDSTVSQMPIKTMDSDKASTLAQQSLDSKLSRQTAFHLNQGSEKESEAVRRRP